MEAEIVERAEQRMNEKDGGLAKYSTECTRGINWEEAKIVGRESGKIQRKMLEGVMKQNARGRKPLNTCNQWQATVFSFLDES